MLPGLTQAAQPCASGPLLAAVPSLFLSARYTCGMPRYSLVPGPGHRVVPGHVAVLPAVPASLRGRQLASRGAPARAVRPVTAVQPGHSMANIGHD
jgi:hypothetical protein